MTVRLFLLWLAAGVAVAAFGQAPLAQQAHALAHDGIREMMNGRLDEALSTFQQVEREDPSSPLGYVLEADATWWEIYYTTANLVDPDVFDVVHSTSTSYDSHFEYLVRESIAKSEARIEARQDVARSDLYEGMAYALQARLDGLRARDLPTARAGKKMRELLLAALERDPNLTDAYAGIGLYNYFVDTLPTIVKMLRFLIGLPGGNRETGLSQLQKAAEQGDFTRAEAKFYLAKDYTRHNEMQFKKSLQLFQELEQNFPGNPFWKLMVASVQMRLGQRRDGESLYRQILAETAQAHNVPGTVVHQQVLEALERLHPDEKFGGGP